MSKANLKQGQMNTNFLDDFKTGFLRKGYNAVFEGICPYCHENIIFNPLSAKDMEELGVAFLKNAGTLKIITGLFSSVFSTSTGNMCKCPVCKKMVSICSKCLEINKADCIYKIGTKCCSCGNDVL